MKPNLKSRVLIGTGLLIQISSILPVVFAQNNPVVPNFILGDARKTFSGFVPIHLLPSNEIIEYFQWDVEVGSQHCPFPGMISRARKGAPSLVLEESLEELADQPSPHCSVDCQCMTNGHYSCKSLCPAPPSDMDYCVPIAIPGECCHRYICDDDLDTTFPDLKYPIVPDSVDAQSISPNSTAQLLCMPGTIIPDSVCHMFFPRAFSGHLGPKGICFTYDDIRCAFLEDNEVDTTPKKEHQEMKFLEAGRPFQTIFFKTEINGTVFSTNVPLKKSRRRRVRA